MRALVALVVAGLVTHAAWRAGAAYIAYYDFQDQLRQLAQFAGDKSVSEVEERARAIAVELDVPVQPHDISVWRERDHTFIDATYQAEIEILPRYWYPWEFQVSVDAWSTAVPRAGDLLSP